MVWSVDLDTAACRLKSMRKSQTKIYVSEQQLFLSNSHKDYGYQSVRIHYNHAHKLSYDMAQPTGYSKNPLNFDPFWEKTSAEPPLEWSKGAAIFEMAVTAKDGIEVINLQRNKPPLIESTESIYEVEINGATEAQKRNREVCNQEKRVGCENHVLKAGEKRVLCNSFRWDEADAKVKSYIFLPVSRGPMSNSAKTPRPNATRGYNKRTNYDSKRHIRNKQNCPVRKIQLYLQKTKESGKSRTFSR